MGIVIFHDLTEHVSIRKLEWLMAGLMIHLGVLLILNPDISIESSIYGILLNWLSVNWWTVIFILTGLVRLLVLIVNGRYLKSGSAHARRIFSGISFLILTAFAFSLDIADTGSTTSLICKWLAFGELANVWQASTDLRTRRKYHA